LKILLIDDDPVVLETVSLMLSADGHTVLTASHAAHGLAQLEAGEAVDLVLTDHSMPEISGLELVRRVQLRWPRLHVGIITGSLDDLPARDLTLDVLLTKPVDLVQLQQAIEQMRAEP
jgi:CheY-like chemotaxis protein